MKKIVILGGGFAGVEAAIKLKKFGYDVTLVSNRSYLFVYPISIWIPVNKKKFEDVTIPLSKLSRVHGFNLIIDDVVSISSNNNSVKLVSQVINYDYLIIAMGMSKVQNKGIENTLSICGNPTESIAIKDRLEELVQKGSGKIAIGFGGNPKDSTATAVRGGPAFELLFNISNYLKKKGVRNNFEITFFAPMNEPGKKMGKNAFGKLDSMFKRYNIKSKIGIKIKEFSKDAVIFEDDTSLSSDLIVFISGGKGHSVVANSNLPLNEAGFIRINNHCKVDNIDNIYAIGDVSALEGPPWAAKQGHIAEVMADVAVTNIHNSIINVSKRIGYQKHLNIICVMDTGDGAAFVYRKGNFDMIVPMPIIGHWLKKGWGMYYINSKLGRFPRIPGM